MRGARGGGALVIHHGSVGYCEGVNVDGAHRWISTGGVPIEYLRDSSAVERRAASGGAHAEPPHGRAPAGGERGLPRRAPVSRAHPPARAPPPEAPRSE